MVLMVWHEGGRVEGQGGSGRHANQASGRVRWLVCKTAVAAAAPAAGSSSGSLTATPSPCRTGSATRMSKSDLEGTCGEDTGQGLLTTSRCSQPSIAIENRSARQRCPRAPWLLALHLLP